MIIKRQKYIDAIAPFIDKPLVKVISGIRRCGKSTLLYQIMEYLKDQGVSEQQIIFINKELFEFDAIRDYRQLHTYITGLSASIKHKYYVFIDEIQEIDSWEKAINSLLASEKYDLYITGSNARLLSSELATLLSGRYISFKIQTLTFAEFKEILQQKDLPGNALAFDIYLKYGGFPGIHHLELTDMVVRQYLESIYDTVLLKDVVLKNNIRDAAMLDTITKYLINNCGNITTATGISQYMKSQRRQVSVDTVLNYIHYSCNAMIFEQAQRYDIKGKRMLETAEKYYMGDIGFRYATQGFTPDAISGLLENIVFLELRARNYIVSVGKTGEKEIDFIAEKGPEKIYIQVCTSLADEKVIHREYGSLEDVKDHFPKIVLSMDHGFDPSRNGIQWMNITDFLLDQ